MSSCSDFFVRHAVRSFRSAPWEAQIRTQKPLCRVNIHAVTKLESGSIHTFSTFSTQLASSSLGVSFEWRNPVEAGFSRRKSCQIFCRKIAAGLRIHNTMNSHWLSVECRGVQSLYDLDFVSMRKRGV